jgi:protein ImuB
VLDAQGRRVGVSGRGLLSAAPFRCRTEDTGAGAHDLDDPLGWSEVRAWAGPWCIDERWWDALAHRRRARLQVVLAPAGGDGSLGTGTRSSGSRSARGSSAHPSHGVAHLLTLEDRRWWIEATYD